MSENLLTSADGQSDNLVESMPAAAKRVLVTLMKFGVILASQKPQQFQTLCQYQQVIRKHLNAVYLKLILDEKTGVAFIASIEEHELDDSSDEPISLVTRRTLTLYDTLVLLVLRKYYQEREIAGEQRIIIDVERLEANLIPFLVLTNNSKTDRRKLNTTLQRLSEKKILAAISNSENRFEITPVIRYVVDAAFLENLLSEYKQLAREAELDNQESV